MFYSHDGLIRRLTEEEAKNPQERSESLIVDIMAAIQVVEEDLSKTLQDVADLTLQGEITFDLLWTLFKPNSLIYSYHYLTEQSRVLIVRQVEYKMNMDRSRYLYMSCDIIHDDGNLFGFAREHLSIGEYKGVRAIQELPTYPLKYHPTTDAIYAEAVGRGRSYVQLPQHSYQEMNGIAVRDTGMGAEKFYVCFHFVRRSGQVPCVDRISYRLPGV